METDWCVRERSVYLLFSLKDMIRYIPIVPRPPTLRYPKRLNGAEQVIIFGVMSRITIDVDGFAGMSLDVMVGKNGDLL